jgi:uncharacterized membrane protein YedE/YeeE
MRSPLAGFIAGLVFGIGLALGGMTDPSIVLAFLDITGAWNPQLMFVMAGGVAVTFVGYRMAARRPAPLWDERFFTPTATRIDAPLIGGAVLFGIGWGLAGYCPGPAIASLGGPYGGVAAFVVAMLAGMIAVRMIRRPGAQSLAANLAAAADH